MDGMKPMGVQRASPSILGCSLTVSSFLLIGFLLFYLSKLQLPYGECLDLDYGPKQSPIMAPLREEQEAGKMERPRQLNGGDPVSFLTTPL